MGTPFRILALDGGGIKGTFSAAVLAELEQQLKIQPFAKRFDLVAGTSTGGIIALAQVNGKSGHDALSLYQNMGTQIFPYSGVVGSIGRVARQVLLGPKYGADGLRAALQKVFGDLKLGACKNRIIIPSYNAVAGSVRVFRYLHRRVEADLDERIVDVALSTAAAPSYFPANEDAQGGRFIDGGVWANSPTLLAVTEAHALLGIPMTEIRVLRIGTTSSPFFVSRRTARGGLLRWNKELLNLVMQAQSGGVSHQVRTLLGGRFMEINEVVEPGRFSLDGAGSIQELKALGTAAAKNSLDAVRTWLTK